MEDGSEHPEYTQPKPRPKLEGVPWPKGVSGNPGGRPTLPKEIREMRNLTGQEFIRVCSELFEMTGDEMNELIKNSKEEKTLKLMVASIILHGIKKGDAVRLSMLLDRVIGKPVDTMVLRGTMVSDSQVQVDLQKLAGNEDLKKMAMEFAALAMKANLEKKE